MSDQVTFTGKAEELPALWFHVMIKGRLDSDLDDEETKTAYAASCFRGKALEWLARTQPTNATMLGDFNTFKALVDEVFGLTPDVVEAQAQARITHLKQNTTVAEFTAEFESLADQLAWPVSARHAFYYQGLKPAIKEMLIATNPGDYTSLKNDARRVEALAVIAHNTPPASLSTGGGSGGKHKKKARPKCSKCGRVGHTGAQCYAKTTVNYIDHKGAREANHIPRRLYVIEEADRHALEDSGSAVSCVRKGMLLQQEWKPSRLELEGANGSTIAHHPRWCIVSLDGKPIKLYEIDNLVEDIILGRDFLHAVTPLDELSINITQRPERVNRHRPLSAPEQDALDQYISEGLSNGVIRKSTAPEGSPVVFAQKKSGALRVCIDFRELNRVTCKDHFPLPLVEQLVERARGHTHYALIDLKNAFNHIRVREEDVYKTAFYTETQMYEHTRMPFGLTNAPSQFQRYIEHVLAPHAAYTLVYIDDILVFSDDEKLHDERVEALLHTLSDNHITVNWEKSHLDEQELDYVGIHIGHGGKISASNKHETLRDWPTPVTKLQLQEFLGLSNYFRQFMPFYAKMAAPLYSSTGKIFTWTQAQSDAFYDLKKETTRMLELSLFSRHLPVDIVTDASLYGLGAILFQQNKPIACVSRGLTPAERNYTTTERELLAVVYAVKKWYYYLESTREPLYVHTDHKAITQALNANGENRRINRWTELLSRFQFQFVHVRGTENPADYPSRRPDYA